MAVHGGHQRSPSAPHPVGTVRPFRHIRGVLVRGAASGDFRRRRLNPWFLVAVTSATFAIAAPMAVAEPISTPQAIGLNASWMQYLPAPAANPVICIIDGGVNLTADTQPITLYRGTVLDSGAVDDIALGDGHGTPIASLISAPRNGVGTVGLWPHARVVSVRATDTVSSFTWANYGFAAGQCLRIPGVVAVNLSLGGPQGPSQPHYESFLTRIQTLQLAGISLVASTGNDGGAPNYPAAIPGVVAVAANDGGGALCSFSSRQPGVLSAPGCPAFASNAAGTGVSAWGTSFASPLAATVIASIRAYRPDLTRQQVEDIVTQSARVQPDGSRALDAEAAYRAADLAGLVTRAKAFEAVSAGGSMTGIAAPSAAITPTGIPRLLWVKVRKNDVIIRLMKPLPHTRVLVLGRRARLLNPTTIRALRTRNTWKLSLILMDRATGRRGRSRAVLIRRTTAAVRAPGAIKARFLR